MRIIKGDILSFCRHYKGKKFHALLCDPPYHLTAKNGKNGFMGKSWDGGDIAFRPETWDAIGELLYPGAFCMAFGGSRTAHRMAVAIEDSGFIIHPMMGWVYGSGFPKATRVKNNEEFEGHRYGAQALKPALEPIIVFQKPYEGRPIDNITEAGAGALNIDGGRIGAGDDIPLGGTYGGIFGSGQKATNESQGKGRWPANLLLQHLPECTPIGNKEDGYAINRFTDGAKPFGDAVGENFDTEDVKNKSVVWECVDGCPVAELDGQTGTLKSGNLDGMIPGASEGGHLAGKLPRMVKRRGDSGGASRFFFQAHYELEKAFPIKYQAKASKSEKNAGLDGVESKRSPTYAWQGEKGDPSDGMFKDRKTTKKNPHPTVKPLSLTEYLARLLLPPKEYPGRILVPFAGVGSEMIGAKLAGWDCVIGVELDEDDQYIEIAKKRITHWTRQRKLI
jgi:site-specific DNA-methyltransferase (adenine-specific)